MKKIFFAILLVLPLSCTKQAQELVGHSTLYVGEATKAGINSELKTFWLHNEPVAVFYNGSAASLWKFEGADGALSGTIGATGSFPEFSYATAVIPFSNDASLSGETVSTVIPSSVSYDGRSTAFSVMVASGNTQPLLFKYASAVVSLTLNSKTDFDVEEIALRGGKDEILTGPASTDRTSPSLVMGEGGTVQTLVFPAEYSGLSGERTFYFGIPPGKYPSGLVFTLTMTDGSIYKVESSTSLSIAAGELKKVNCDLYMDGIVMFDLSFNNKSYPFTYKTSGEVVKGKHASADEGDVLIAQGKDGENYEFTIFSQNEGYYFTGNYFRLTTGTGETGAGPAWIKFPKVKDHTLCSIGIKLNNETADTRTFYVTSEPDDKNPLSTIRITTVEGAGSDMIISYVPESPTGEYYLFGRGGAKNAQIERILLNYE